MCLFLFSHHLQPEWKREFEGNEISAGPRIWLPCSGEGIKLIKGSNESQRQTREEGEQWLLHTQLPQAVVPGYFLHQCFQSPLFEVFIPVLLWSCPSLCWTLFYLWPTLQVFPARSELVNLTAGPHVPFFVYFSHSDFSDLFPTLGLGKTETGVTQILMTVSWVMRI